MGTSPTTYTYDAYGKLISTSYKNGGNTIDAVVNNSILYRGYYFDRDLGLYYLISRYYDPNTGRFISPDHISVIAMSPTELTDKNLYAYCDNNPIMRVDPTGDFWISLFAGAVLGAAINIASSYLITVANLEEYTWENALLDGLSGAITGAVAAVTTSVLWQVAAGSVSGFVSSSLSDLMSGEKFNYVKAINSVVVGGAAAYIGGSGMGVHKRGMNSALNKLAIVFKEGFKPFAKSSFLSVGAMYAYNYING